MNISGKYRVLRIIALVLKVLAWVALAGAVIALVFGVPSFLGALARGAPWYEVAPLAALLGLPIFGLVWFVQLFAFGSILVLLIDIEENTRAMAARIGGS